MKILFYQEPVISVFSAVGLNAERLIQPLVYDQPYQCYVLRQTKVFINNIVRKIYHCIKILLAHNLQSAAVTWRMVYRLGGLIRHLVWYDQTGFFLTAAETKLQQWNGQFS